MCMRFSKKPLSIIVGGLIGISATIQLASAEEVQQVSAYQEADSAKAGSSTSNASSAGANASNRLENVLVTAQRRKENIQQVPSAVSVIGGDKLVATGVGRTAAEITQFVPNTSAGQSNGHSRPRWWIRGVGTGTQGLDSPSPVGIYLDDVYISNASATAFPLFDLERVEVLRGPQGTLWGKNTTGGAINLISQKPRFTPDGYLKLDQGSHDSTLIQGAVGGAIIEDSLAARISIHQDTRDGLFNNSFTGEKDFAYRDSATRIQLLSRPADDVELLFNLHYRDYRTDGANATVIGTGTNGAFWTNGATYIPSKDRTIVSSNVDQFSDISQDGALLNLNWALPGGYELTSITAYEGYDSQSLSDSDNTPLEISRGYTDAKTSQRSQEIRLASPKDGNYHWVAGVHYFTDRINSDAASGTLPTAQKPVGRADAYSDTVYRHDSESYAIFGNLTYNVTDRFSFTSGLRWSREEKSIDLYYYQATPNPVIFNDQTRWWLPSSVSSPIALRVRQDDTNDWSDWTYDLTPAYELSDSSRVYARVARGFRGGGYNSAPRTQDSISVLEPEYLTSYEVGYKSEWLDGQLLLNANVFTYEYEDIQINAVLPSPTGALSQLRNAAEGDARGAELEIQALVTANLQVRIGLGWLDTEFSNFSDVNGDYSGNRFVRSPEFSGVLSLDYQYPLENGSSLTLGTDWNYQTRYYFYTNNQTDPNLAQDDYGTGSARISWKSVDERITLSIYANNLNDKQYKLHTLPPAAGAAGNTVNWSEPRNYGVSLVTRF
ncbi:TonB-dependent receptor [Cellvibrio japonicus]|nr:TonB-dependent receptor [Cellvibrio japonicus]QEI16321.1 TonB-dependent receptor [Cellvibrio japonicus]QEI19899.1 TonB-dependent receptor [Cellvibrio japonicus]